MESSHIISIFQDYLKSESAKYALLLNGGWGSGKTHFWKETLMEICAKNSYKTSYISLNGISRIENLDYRLKIKLIPLLKKLDGKKAVSLTNLLKNMVGKVIQSKYDISIQEILKDVEMDMIHFRRQVICFDDLERCNIPLTEVLGYINDFVEHKGLKVIILSDESKIKNEIDQEDTSYNSIKEKVIGRVLNFNHDLNSIFPVFVAKYRISDPEFASFLDHNKSYMLELLKEFKEVNLRNLSFYLEALAKLFPFFKSDSKVEKEIILFTLIITLEFKRGMLTSIDYKNFKQYDLLNPSYVSFNFEKSLTALFKNKDKEEKESDLEKFYSRYLKKFIEDYFFYPSVYEFILTGYLDSHIFKEELKNRVPIELSMEEQVFADVATNRFRQLSDKEFNLKVEQLIDFAKEGRYEVMYYIHISKFLNLYSENNLIKYNADEIREMLLDGLQIARQSIVIEKKHRKYAYDIPHDPSVDPTLRERIIEYTKESLKEFEKENTDQLLTAIASNNLEMMEKIFQEYQTNDELFQNFTANNLWFHLNDSENKTLLHFIKLLEERHGFANVGSYFSNNVLFFNDLIAVVKNSKEDPVLREMLKKELVSILQDLCSRIL